MEMKNLLPKNKIKLDHLGQFYAAASNKNNPGTFSIAVNLKENIVPEALQQAVNDLMKRLPHLGVPDKGLYVVLQ